MEENATGQPRQRSAIVRSRGLTSLKKALLAARTRLPGAATHLLVEGAALAEAQLVTHQKSLAF